jgi:hypothetical protein
MCTAAVMFHRTIHTLAVFGRGSDGALVRCRFSALMTAILASISGPARKVSD